VVAHSQHQGKPAARLGVLVRDPDTDPNFGSFREALRDLGYVEPRNLVYEYRYAEGTHSELFRF
jgi:hypothetical protein